MKSHVQTILVFGGILANAAASWALDEGTLVRTIRHTPAFQLPSASATVLADVDAGVLLLVRKISPKGTWLLLEDEDGNAGWVPTNRTDFGGVQHPAEPVFPESSEEAPSVREDHTPRLRHEIAGELRFVTRTENPSAGFVYSLLFPQVPSRWRVSWFGLQTGYLQQNKLSGWAIPLRLRNLRRTANSHFGFGADFGVTFQHRISSGPSGLSLNLGYTAGWYGEKYFASTRGAVDFKPATRFSLELALGVVF